MVQTKFCINCGALILAIAKFCSECGSSQGNIELPNQSAEVNEINKTKVKIRFKGKFRIYGDSEGKIGDLVPHSTVRIRSSILTNKNINTMYHTEIGMYLMPYCLAVELCRLWLSIYLIDL